jgi:murein L,D-transpeptidase YafK
MVKLLLTFFTLTLATLGVQAKELEVNKVIVHKAERRIELVHLTRSGETQVIREYTIMLGRNPIGHKEQEGDNRTPEGRYTLDWKNPNSAFHLSIHINYPNRQDRARAQARGVSPGGEIFIHGMPNNISQYRRMYPNLPHEEARELIHRFLSNFDWTAGCIAVLNHEMEEIWRLVKVPTPILILP